MCESGVHFNSEVAPKWQLNTHTHTQMEMEEKEEEEGMEKKISVEIG